MRSNRETRGCETAAKLSREVKIRIVNRTRRGEGEPSAGRASGILFQERYYSSNVFESINKKGESECDENSFSSSKEKQLRTERCEAPAKNIVDT